MKPSDIPGIGELTSSEKILLVEDLWDEIGLEEERVGVPDSHKKELDRRLENYTNNPGRLLTLEELQIRVDSRK